jgi:hypothetical protein
MNNEFFFNFVKLNKILIFVIVRMTVSLTFLKNNKSFHFAFCRASKLSNDIEHFFVGNTPVFDL